MPRLKLRRIDFWFYLIVAFILGILAVVCFSSPSSEARFETLDGVESGFFASISNPANSIAVGAAQRSAPTFTENNTEFRPAAAVKLSIAPMMLTGARASYLASGCGKAGCVRRFIISAYCPCEKCCGIYSDGITASGHKIQPGDRFVAAPPEIPFGTKLSIPGYAGGSMVSVEDRGGKIKGNKIDVFFDSHSEALKWGVKELLVAQGESK